MSKSLSQILLPALGASALVIATGVTFLNRDFGRDKIEVLESRVERSQENEARALEEAKAEASRAAELDKKVAEIQAVAAEQVARGGSLTEPAPRVGAKYGLGRPAHTDEIAAWDVDILPDGRGLPKGRGDVFTGEEVFAEQCAACHGDFAEGVDNWPVLAGGFDTLADEDPVKTVGSYWPYLSTVWDYVHRSMPFGGAQTLSDDEVYAIVAYILYSNDLVDDDFELSHENFADFEMHNKDGFILDDRAETEYPLWRQEPCMENCKDNVEITMRASVLDVTPDEGGSEADQAMEDHSSASDTVVVGETKTASLQFDAALVAAGEKVFKKCAACHAVGDGAKNKSGPILNGVMGRVFGAVDGFKYSNAFKAASEEGRVWTAEELAGFLTKPKSYIKGTKMAFSGLKKAEDIAAITEYLNSFAE